MLVASPMCTWSLSARITTLNQMLTAFSRMIEPASVASQAM
jgi:hypothetical protein